MIVTNIVTDIVVLLIMFIRMWTGTSTGILESTSSTLWTSIRCKPTITSCPMTMMTPMVSRMFVSLSGWKGRLSAVCSSRIFLSTARLDDHKYNFPFFPAVSVNSFHIFLCLLLFLTILMHYFSILFWLSILSFPYFSLRIKCLKMSLNVLVFKNELVKILAPFSLEIFFYYENCLDLSWQ